MTFIQQVSQELGKALAAGKPEAVDTLAEVLVDSMLNDPLCFDCGRNKATCYMVRDSEGIYHPTLCQQCRDFETLSADELEDDSRHRDYEDARWMGDV